MKIVFKSDFNGFMDAMIGDESVDVEGVMAKGEKFVFGPLESSSDLRLDYDTTILPPKKYFLPQYETMMKFDISHPFKVEEVEHPKKKVIVGVHPYDIVAIQQMDRYFLDKEASSSYLRRRRSTMIIGSDVLNISEKAFFGCMGTGTVSSGYDLFLTDLGNRVVIEIGSEEGEKLLERVSGCREASSVDVQKVMAVRETNSSRAMRGIKVKPQGWYGLLERNYDSEVWKTQSDKCLACGTCTLVCPTCFCYDVVDDVSIDMKSGERKKTWDGCLLREFTEIASGEVFREDIVDRYRHRFNRKGRYLPDRLGFLACVGCGRCSSQCVPDIADPVNLINMLFEASPYLVNETKMDAHPVETDMPEVQDVRSLHIPEPATLKEVKRLTEGETFFEIELDSGRPLGHGPGQFVEVSLFGTGEAPISVSSAPGGDTFEIVVRKVGDVTNKLHTLKQGDKVGIRGPFGKGFDPEELKGRNILFISGGLGIIPMRSLINYVLDSNNRRNFRDVTILYGAKNPRELLFMDEIEEWKKVEGVRCELTVDQCSNEDCWTGCTGVITTLFPKIELDRYDSENTMAIVIGPPIMYKFVLQCLLTLGIPDGNIYVSLERRMKCGVGKCGHCQMGNLYVCKEGPVFNYSDVKDIPEAFE